MNQRQTTLFASLFVLSGTAQTIIMSVLPVRALEIIGSPGAVSLAYVGVGVAAFGGRFAIPALIGRIGRLGLATTAAAGLAIGAVLLQTGTVAGLLVGLAANVFMVACFEVILSLYVLDNIPRGELGRFEPRRIFFAATPYTFGPWLGIYLDLHVAPWVPFVIAVAAAGVLCVAIRAARLREGPLHGVVRPPTSPLRYVGRFFRQPRLRLAWGLAIGRSAWWSSFFIYAPIAAVEGGLGAETGGIIVSIGLGWLWFVPLWGWVGRRWGLRRLLLLGYLATGVGSIAAGLAMGTPWLGAVLLLVAAFACESIDGAGNTLFLRAVHPHERSEMTAVFAGYRDIAQLVPPAIFAGLLAVFPVSAVFLTGGVMMIALSGLARYIPRRL
jgi:MFS family permease